MSGQGDTVFVSCRDTAPHAGWLRTGGTYVLTVLGAGSPKSWRGQEPLPLNPAGKSPPRPRLSRLRGSPAGPGFGPRRADLGLCGHVAIFSHGRQSLPRPAFYKDASRIGRGPALLRYDRLNRSHPQWLYFQRRSHSEARGVRTSARLTFWSGRSRLNPPQGHRQRDSGEEARGRGVPFPGVGSVSVPLFFHRRPQPS